MLLDIDRFGSLSQSTYGIGGKPVAKVKFIIYLIDTENNDLLGRYFVYNTDSFLKKYKENDFQEYKRKVEELLIESLKEAYFGFFKQSE